MILFAIALWLQHRLLWRHAQTEPTTAVFVMYCSI